MKLIVLTTCLLGSTLLMAQKDRSKDVSTKYLSLPAYDVSAVDPATVTAEFAMSEGIFTQERQREYESICKPKGGSVKDAVKITTYYYEMTYRQPESFIVAKAADGTIVYAAKASEKGEGIVKYGYDKCEYWILDKLKKDWAKEASSFRASERSKYENSVYQSATQMAADNIYLSYVQEEFAVYSAKGKVYDYTALDEAFDTAMLAYEEIKEKGPNQGSFDKLKKAIATWEKELETVDLEDKKARITEEIAKGLHENCARAYMYMYDFDNAKKHGRSFSKLFGNFHNNRTNAFDEAMKRMAVQEVAAKKNESMMGDIEALAAKASTSNSVSVTRLTDGDVERLTSEYYKYVGSQVSDVVQEQKEEEAALIASGELNPYQKYVQTGLTGPVIMMTMAPSALSGIPELTELPKEMCEFTDLTQLLILNNKIETIAPEIGNLTELTKLDLSGNNIKTLPAEIGNLKNLKTLKLSDNPLESIPKEIANLENLSSLVLKDTNLTAEQKEELERLLPSNCKVKY